MMSKNKEDDNSDLLDELSKLNNELTNTRRKLEKKSIELERANELKNRMLGMASHDLRSPLSVIGNYADFLIDDYERDHCFTEQQLEMISEIKHSNEYMIGIVEDLLDISAIESGSIHLDKSKCDLGKLIRRVITVNQPLADKKRIHIKADLPEETLEYELDERRMEQVLTNLVSNAIKFSYPETTINVGVTVKSREKNSYTLYVKDEGQGIPEKELNKLFKPFSKTSITPTAKEKSTGLGLAISKKIVEAHGGSIRAENNDVKGAIFIIDFAFSS